MLPTGGGKSRCYQVPPLVADRMDIVVSPLISLMKDQVDGLRANGYAAAAVHSGLSGPELDEVREGVRDGKCRLLFLTPERLLTPRFIEFLARRNVRAFSIDEAHCISHWGHDFRPEYRRLVQLKEHFPDASVHAYTATATERVQEDIVRQLALKDPRVLVGVFDRPNLVYRVVPSVSVYVQTLEVIRRHADEAVIVYCITRRDTEELAAFLAANGVNAAPYHAGMEKAQRSSTQEAFAAERLDVVVATVAFGMGIDRSNVRCVIHAAMPKSIEHYQQETGRAGRDGLEAECVLLYSAADAIRWERIFELGARDAEERDEEAAAAQLELLHHMQGLCGTLECRHRSLSRYFGQAYESPNCGACDVCLGEIDGMKKGTETAQKIISCVYRLDQRWGVGYVVQVLRGADTEQVRQRGHDTLSTYGLLKNRAEKTLINLVYQLVDQGLLTRTPGDRPILQLNDESYEVLRGEREVKLIEPHSGPVQKTELAETAWEGVDEGLFARLRELRREQAQQRKVPAYVIFDDRTLRELARVRPTTPEAMGSVKGVGKKKLTDYGATFTEAIEGYCESHDLETDVNVIIVPERKKSARPNVIKDKAMAMFGDGATVEEVAAETGRAPCTVWGYLGQYIEASKPRRIDTWVDDATYERIAEAAAAVAAGEQLRPVYVELNGETPYELIRLVVTHQRVMAE